MNLGGPSAAGFSDGLGSVFFNAPVPSGMHLHDGGVHFDGLDLDAHDLLALQQFEDLVQHAALGPAIHAGVDGVPGAETLGQSAPLAAMLGDVQQRIEELQIGHPHVAALARQRSLDPAKLLLG